MEQALKQKPLVSVIMPSYNSEKYISETLKSVRAQSFPDWELLILDDASTDDTVKLARSYEAIDSRIRLYKNSRNMGVANSRNRGISLAKGEWIAFLDSDDIWHEDKLEIQLKRASQTGAKIIYTSYAMFGEGMSDSVPYYVPAEIDYEGMLRENVMGCSTVLACRDLLRENPFSTNIYHEDYALWLRLLRIGTVAVGCTQVLVDWRVSQTGRSFNKRSAAKNRWIIYRQQEKLPLFKAAHVFWVYAWRGFAKHKRL